MTRKDRMNEQIFRHGVNVKAIFGLDCSAVSIAKSLHRLEVKAHRLAEMECNGDAVPEGWEESIFKSLDNLLHFTAKGIPVLVNGDPRGYALKIDDGYVREKRVDIYRDWGGYGILAPEFDGKY